MIKKADILIILIAAVLSAALLAGCADGVDKAQTESDKSAEENYNEIVQSVSQSYASETTTAPESDYSLVRAMTMEEMCETVVLDGVKTGFPLDTAALPEGFSYSDSVLETPSGKRVEAVCGSDGKIEELTVDLYVLSDGFSVCGISGGAVTEDIMKKVGIANKIDGDVERSKDSSGSMTFVGAGEQELIFNISKGSVKSFTIRYK